ncbi:MAG: sulfur carrier protein [Actinomycetota bacterium]|nr:sulfur carrier protein [Actinomycetota bacterium]
MNLVVNGEAREVGEGTTLVDLIPQRIDEGAGEARGIAVARNGEVVPKTEWAAVEVQAGDRIEVLNAIGGG